MTNMILNTAEPITPETPVLSKLKKIYRVTIYKVLHKKGFQ